MQQRGEATMEDQVKEIQQIRTLMGQMCRTPDDCRLLTCKFMHNSDSWKSQRAEFILGSALEEGIEIP